MIEIIHILLESILISMLCIGFIICYSHNHILSFVGKALTWMHDKGGILHYIQKPLGGCPYCMASIYGILVHFCLVQKGMGVSFDLLAPVLLISVFLNGVFYEVIKKLNPRLF